MIRSILRAMNEGRLKPLDLGLGTALLFGLGWPLYLIWPSLLPVRLLEGPMVQQSSTTGANIVWTLSRPAECDVQLNGDAADLVVTADKARCVAAIRGLEPNQKYAYFIRTQGMNPKLFSDGIFRTDKPADAAFRFVVFGDSGKGFFAQYELATLMKKEEPDFLLHTGDLIYGGGERDRYPNRFFGPYHEMLAEITFWPCVGNHDVKNVESIEGVFDAPENGPADLQPEHNYWFDYGDARIVVIDSTLKGEDLETKVGPWLDSVFAESDKTWRIVSFHHPPYTAGNHKPNERVQKHLVPALERNRVDIVFNGHDHLYERTVPLRGGAEASRDDGIVYVVTGGGGARMYSMVPESERPAYLAASYDGAHSFTVVDIDEGGLHLRQIALGGDVVDEYTLEPRTAVVVDEEKATEAVAVPDGE